MLNTLTSWTALCMRDYNFCDRIFQTYTEANNNRKPKKNNCIGSSIELCQKYLYGFARARHHSVALHKSQLATTFHGVFQDEMNNVAEIIFSMFRLYWSFHCKCTVSVRNVIIMWSIYDEIWNMKLGGPLDFGYFVSTDSNFYLFLVPFVCTFSHMRLPQKRKAS